VEESWSTDRAPHSWRRLVRQPCVTPWCAPQTFYRKYMASPLRDSPPTSKSLSPTYSKLIHSHMWKFLLYFLLVKEAEAFKSGLFRITAMPRPVIRFVHFVSFTLLWMCAKFKAIPKHTLSLDSLTVSVISPHEQPMVGTPDCGRCSRVTQRAYGWLSPRGRGIVCVWGSLYVELTYHVHLNCVNTDQWMSTFIGIVAPIYELISLNCSLQN